MPLPVHSLTIGCREGFTGGGVNGRNHILGPGRIVREVIIENGLGRPALPGGIIFRFRHVLPQNEINQSD